MNSELKKQLVKALPQLAHIGKVYVTDNSNEEVAEALAEATNNYPDSGIQLPALVEELFVVFNLSDEELMKLIGINILRLGYKDANFFRENLTDICNSLRVPAVEPSLVLDKLLLIKTFPWIFISKEVLTENNHEVSTEFKSDLRNEVGALYLSKNYELMRLTLLNLLGLNLTLSEANKFLEEVWMKLG